MRASPRLSFASSLIHVPACAALFALAGCSGGTDTATTGGATTTTTGSTTQTDPGCTTASCEGPGGVTFEKTVLSTEFLTEGAAIADFDHDGHPDVLAGPYLYIGPAFTKKLTIATPTVFDVKIYSNDFFSFAYDFDGDGWLDVLKVGFPGQDLRWLQNPQGKDGLWTVHTVFQGVDDESPTFVDITGDGRPELVCAHGGALGWLSFDPKDPTATWVFHPISPNLGFQAFSHGLGTGDVNGDGRVDVLEAEGIWPQPASIAGDPWWKQDAGSFGPGGGQMFATDVDGDGDADILATWQAHGYGWSWFEQQPGSGGAASKFVEHAMAPKAADDPTPGLLLHEPHAMELGDLDGDGLGDVVTGERFWGHYPGGNASFDEPAKVVWYRLTRDAAGAHLTPRIIDEASGIGTQIAVGDADGDGKLDIVTANKKGTFLFLQRTKGG